MLTTFLPLQLREEKREKEDEIYLKLPPPPPNIIRDFPEYLTTAVGRFRVSGEEPFFDKVKKLTLTF